MNINKMKSSNPNHFESLLSGTKLTDSFILILSEILLLYLAYIFFLLDNECAISDLNPAIFESAMQMLSISAYSL